MTMPDIFGHTCWNGDKTPQIVLMCCGKYVQLRRLRLTHLSIFLHEAGDEWRLELVAFAMEPNSPAILKQDIEWNQSQQR